MRDFKLETYFSKWEFTARYNMAASDVESLSVSDLLAMSTIDDKKAFHELWLGYTETFGKKELRYEISKTYDSAIPENILCFAGAEEGIYVAMRVLLSHNDHAIIVVPNYQSAETIPLDICEVSGVPLNPEENWSLDIDRIKNEIRPNTKLISINFPNNPTGAILARERLDELINICRQSGLYLFSDEVYRLMEHDIRLRLPQVGDIYERGLSLNVMSKAYGLPGLRLGWIMCKDENILQNMERYKHYLSICNSAPSEHLSIIALKAKQKILDRNRTIINSNIKILCEFFNEFSNLFDWVIPDGSCVGYPRYIGTSSANEFCEDLVEKTGVLLLPPKIYNSELIKTPKDRFRIGYGRSTLVDGLKVMKNYLNE
ncbi:MAG: aminotransferase class I/II-fold pyridoxal phosphate-dependent enzyme [Candidatus Marinimicrobia bacterium]|nr:aminotransferase class I/II-fold pyridoxal phosphate-dependent enzyme [Candidatus Neomarinimicrobiota bacterium]